MGEYFQGNSITRGMGNKGLGEGPRKEAHLGQGGREGPGAVRLGLERWRGESGNVLSSPHWGCQRRSWLTLLKRKRKIQVTNCMPYRMCPHVEAESQVWIQLSRFNPGSPPLAMTDNSGKDRNLLCLASSSVQWKS